MVLKGKLVIISRAATVIVPLSSAHFSVPIYKNQHMIKQLTQQFLSFLEWMNIMTVGLIVAENKEVLSLEFILQTMMLCGSWPRLSATQSRLQKRTNWGGVKHHDGAWQQQPGCCRSHTANHDRYHTIICTSRGRRRANDLPASATGPHCQPESASKAGISCGTARGFTSAVPETAQAKQTTVQHLHRSRPHMSRRGTRKLD